MDGSWPVADAVDGVGLVVRDQQTAVRHDLQIDGTPPGAAVFLQPSCGESFVGDGAVVPEPNQGDAITVGDGAVPGTVFGDEDLLAVAGGEHAAGIEAHAEGGYMGAKLHLRRDELFAASLHPVLRVGDVPSVPVRETEMEPGFGGAIEFVRGPIVPQPVAAVVGEPEFAAAGMPVEADGVAHPMGKDLQVAAVRVHAHDRSEAWILLLADVAGGSHRDVEFVVRPEADELPAVVTLVRERGIDDHRFWWRPQPGFDVIKAQDAIDLRHVKGAFTKSHTVRRAQSAGDDEHFVGLLVVVAVDQSVDLPRAAAADKDGPQGAEGQGAGARHLVRVDGDSKAGGEFDGVRWQRCAATGGAQRQAEDDRAKQALQDQRLHTIHFHHKASSCPKFILIAAERNPAGWLFFRSRLCYYPPPIHLKRQAS